MADTDGARTGALLDSMTEEERKTLAFLEDDVFLLISGLVGLNKPSILFNGRLMSLFAVAGTLCSGWLVYLKLLMSSRPLKEEAGRWGRGSHSVVSAMMKLL